MSLYNNWTQEEEEEEDVGLEKGDTDARAPPPYFHIRLFPEWLPIIIADEMERERVRESIPVAVGAVEVGGLSNRTAFIAQ